MNSTRQTSTADEMHIRSINITYDYDSLNYNIDSLEYWPNKLMNVFTPLTIYNDTQLDKNWVKHFSLNINDIWNESSARDLDLSSNSNYDPAQHSAIVIGAGPSIKKKKHLEMLAESNYQGNIVCTDRSLIPCLKAGITPDKFPNFTVVSLFIYVDNHLISWNNGFPKTRTVNTHEIDEFTLCLLP